MKNLMRKLLVIGMLSFVSTGVFAQKNDEKRPPKDRDTKVVVKDKERERPPQNTNQDKKDNDKKGKP